MSVNYVSNTCHLFQAYFLWVLLEAAPRRDWGSLTEWLSRLPPRWTESCVWDTVREIEKVWSWLQSACRPHLRQLISPKEVRDYNGSEQPRGNINKKFEICYNTSSLFHPPPPKAAEETSFARFLEKGKRSGTRGDLKWRISAGRKRLSLGAQKEKDPRWR